MHLIAETILNWIYPPVCISCKTILPVNAKNFYICAKCMPLFEEVQAPYCQKCGAVLKNADVICGSCFGKELFFDSCRSGFLYDDIMSEALADMKFKGRKRAAWGLGIAWAACFWPPDKDCVLVPLPLHKKKKKERGFNQAEVLTRALTSSLGIRWEAMLVRTVDTPPQAGLHPKQREENVRGVFTVAPGYSPVGKIIAIVDDIYTTGSSINECARVLREAGADQVHARTLARTLRKKRDEDEVDDAEKMSNDNLLI